LVPRARSSSPAGRAARARILPALELPRPQPPRARAATIRPPDILSRPRLRARVRGLQDPVPVRLPPQYKAVRLFVRRRLAALRRNRRPGHARMGRTGAAG